MHTANEGKIFTSGDSRLVTAKYDGNIRRDGTFRYGPCVSNNARAQQIATGLYGASGISTSRSEDVAIGFATRGLKVPGIIYVIDGALAKAEGIELLEFDNPRVPQHQEVTLILLDHQTYLPEHLIIKKYCIDKNGVKAKFSSAQSQ